MRIKSFVGSGLAVVLSVSSALSGAAYQFSEYGFSRNPARLDNSLRVSMGRTDLRRYRFVGRVGGVSFDNAVDLSGKSITLAYKRASEDGTRALMMVDGSVASLPLYDWELKPLVEYAESEYNAVVSIFGEGDDAENYRYIDYHPAFENTHLGLRLLQADILPLDPVIFGEVPTEGGVKVYESGESREQALNIRYAGAVVIQGILQSEPYQSWVLTDAGDGGNVSIRQGVLEVDVEPYYYIWKSNIEEVKVLAREYDGLLETLRPLVSEYESAFSRYENSPAGSQAEHRAKIEVQRLERVLEGGTAKLSRLKSMIEGFEPEVVEVAKLTAEMRAAEPVLHGVAPFVYDAVRKTAQYAALFRGVKKHHPKEWASFRNAVVQSVSIAPVETPNQFNRAPSHQ